MCWECVTFVFNKEMVLGQTSEKTNIRVINVREDKRQRRQCQRRQTSEWDEHQRKNTMPNFLLDNRLFVKFMYFRS